jgi:hypothetical protein
VGIMESLYHVWQRKPDGYIAASCGSKPHGWTQVNGTVITFEHLGTFNEWYGKGGAAEFIAKEYESRCEYCKSGETPYFSETGHLTHGINKICGVVEG